MLRATGEGIMFRKQVLKIKAWLIFLRRKAEGESSQESIMNKIFPPISLQVLSRH